MKKLYLSLIFISVSSFYAKTEHTVVIEKISLDDYLDYTTDVLKSLCHQYECLHKNNNYDLRLFAESKAMVDYINECIETPTEECKRLFSNELDKEFLSLTTPGSKSVFKSIKNMVKEKYAQKIILQDYLEYLQDIFKSLINSIDYHRQNQLSSSSLHTEAQKMVDYINLCLKVPAKECIHLLKGEVEREAILTFTSEGSKKTFMAMKSIVG